MKDRLIKAYEYLRSIGKVHSQQDVANIMKSPKATISRAFNGNERYLTKSFLERFNNAFNSIFDLNWLISGKNTMLNNDAFEGTTEYEPKVSYTKGVPYYNVDFICGFDLVLNDQSVTPEYLIDFQQYNEADCWCNVTGHSMEPEISNGDIIALKKIDDIRFIPYGEIYAIVTTNDMRTIKRIGPSDDPSMYRLIPINQSPEYGEQDIPKDMVQIVFQVLGCVKKL